MHEIPAVLIGPDDLLEVIEEKRRSCDNPSGVS